MSDTSPQVFLVGAGPGNPGLLTLRAVECLSNADLILYDQLVPVRLLDQAPASAERICVTAFGSYSDRWQGIHRAMIDAARQGKRVVRLKGGDPFLFGRGGEEAQALREAGIGFEIVPGVTAALGAAAFAGIPLTHRLHSSAVAFVTGYEDPTKESHTLDWSALAHFPGTLVFYMAITRLGPITSTLIALGKPTGTPAGVISRATTPAQRTLTTTLGQLPEAVAAAGITSPAVVIIGPVVALRESLQWFDQRPLFGKRVLVTRPRFQAGALVNRIEDLGGTAYVLPVIEIREPADWSRVDAAFGRLSSYQWLVFTSVNGVHFFLRRLLATRRDLRSLGSLRLAAIGPSTADALRFYHLEPDLIPTEYCSESLAAALKERAGGQRILLARADRGRELLRQELAKAAHVDQVSVYSQVDAVDPNSEALERLRQREIDFVTLTSSNIGRSLLRALDAPTVERIHTGEVRLVSISPVTSQTVRELGLPVAAEAMTYTTEGLVNALVGLASQRTSR